MDITQGLTKLQRQAILRIGLEGAECARFIRNGTMRSLFERNIIELAYNSEGEVRVLNLTAQGQKIYSRLATDNPKVFLAADELLKACMAMVAVLEKRPELTSEERIALDLGQLAFKKAVPNG